MYIKYKSLSNQSIQIVNVNVQNCKTITTENNKLMINMPEDSKDKTAIFTLSSTEDAKKSLDKLFDVCSTRYINIQRELATAVQSEIIVVTNISINKQNLEKAIEENDAEKIHYYTNKINASIQKKLNYETIVNECNSRLEACIEQISDFSEKIKIEENINVAKKEKNRILEFFNKLIKNLNRKKNFQNYVLKPSENYIECLTDEVDKSIGSLYNQIFEFAVQMKDNKDKINMAFNAMMQG